MIYFDKSITPLIVARTAMLKASDTYPLDINTEIFPSLVYLLLLETISVLTGGVGAFASSSFILCDV